jgi:hypothetical protein
MSSTNITLSKVDPVQKPVKSLRDSEGLGPAISKTVKPFHSITAQFRDPKPVRNLL